MDIVDGAKALAIEHRAIVIVSGAIDVLTDGVSVVKNENGHPIMSKVTGMGCASTALLGAFASINPNALQASSHCVALVNICGEIAFKKSNGPGSFKPLFLDQLFNITVEEIRAHGNFS